jgi:hypothetical protein
LGPEGPELLGPKFDVLLGPEGPELLGPKFDVLLGWELLLLSLGFLLALTGTATRLTEPITKRVAIDLMLMIILSCL